MGAFSGNIFRIMAEIDKFATGLPPSQNMSRVFLDILRVLHAPPKNMNTIERKYLNTSARSRTTPFLYKKIKNSHSTKFTNFPEVNVLYALLTYGFAKNQFMPHEHRFLTKLLTGISPSPIQSAKAALVNKRPPPRPSPRPVTNARPQPRRRVFGLF